MRRAGILDAVICDTKAEPDLNNFVLQKKTTEEFANVPRPAV